MRNLIESCPEVNTLLTRTLIKATIQMMRAQDVGITEPGASRALEVATALFQQARGLVATVQGFPVASMVLSDAMAIYNSARGMDEVKHAVVEIDEKQCRAETARDILKSKQAALLMLGEDITGPQKSLLTQIEKLLVDV